MFAPDGKELARLLKAQHELDDANAQKLGSNQNRVLDRIEAGLGLEV
jgi:hypothetical protein